MSTSLLHLACTALLLPHLLLAPAQEVPRDPFSEPPALAAARPLDGEADRHLPTLKGLALRADGEARALLETSRGEVLLLGVGDTLTLGGTLHEVRAITASGVRLIRGPGGVEIHLR